MASNPRLIVVTYHTRPDTRSKGRDDNTLCVEIFLPNPPADTYSFRHHRPRKSVRGGFARVVVSRVKNYADRVFFRGENSNMYASKRILLIYLFICIYLYAPYHRRV